MPKGKTFWKPRSGRWGYFCAEYYPINQHDVWLNKKFSTGPEREAFIREQNQLVRKCKSDQEYLEIYYSVLTLTQ